MTRVRFIIEGELDMDPGEIAGLGDLDPKTLLDMANWGMTVDYETAVGRDDG